MTMTIISHLQPATVEQIKYKTLVE